MIYCLLQELGETSSYQFHQAGPEARAIDNTDTVDRPTANGETQARGSAMHRRPSSRRREIEEEPVLEGNVDHTLSPPNIEETLSGM